MGRGACTVLMPRIVLAALVVPFAVSLSMPIGHAPSYSVYIAQDNLNHTVLLVPSFPMETRSDERPVPFAAKTWDGGGADNNWSTCANWNGDTCPVTNDIVTFDATSTKSCTVDIAVPVLGTVTIASAYANTVTVSVNQTNTWGNLVVGASLNTGSRVMVTGSVSVNVSTAYLVLGSSVWTATGSWTNSSTSASWSGGTSHVILSSSSSVNITPAGTNLPVDEFYDVTVQSASGISYTIQTRDLHVGNTLTVKGTGTAYVNLITNSRGIVADSILVQSLGRVLMSGTSDFVTFGTLQVTGTGVYQPSTPAVFAFRLDVDTGTVTTSIFDWDSYAPPSSVSWTMNPNMAGATVTIAFDSMSPGVSYDLRRDVVVVQTVMADGTGHVQFSVTGGWSSHALSVSQTNAPGTGLSIQTWFALILIIILLALGVFHPLFWFFDSFVIWYSVSTVNADLPNTLWGLVLIVVGIFVIVLSLARMMDDGGLRR